MTFEVLFHWFTCVAWITFLLMLSNICLLMIPISDLLGFTSRQVGLFIKPGLWSFMAINKSLFAETSIRLSSPSLSATFLSTEVITSGTFWSAFLWAFVTFLSVTPKRRPCRLQTADCRLQTVQTVQTVQTEYFFSYPCFCIHF